MTKLDIFVFNTAITISGMYKFNKYLTIHPQYHIALTCDLILSDSVVFSRCLLRKLQVLLFSKIITNIPDDY